MQKKATFEVPLYKPFPEDMTVASDGGLGIEDLNWWRLHLCEDSITWSGIHSLHPLFVQLWKLDFANPLDKRERLDEIGKGMFGRKDIHCLTDRQCRRRNCISQSPVYVSSVSSDVVRSVSLGMHTHCSSRALYEKNRKGDPQVE